MKSLSKTGLFSASLAVIAIIYGFLQSDAQQQSSARISGEVEKLTKISGELSESPKELQRQLEVVQTIISSLHRFDDRLNKIDAGQQAIIANLASFTVPKTSTPSGEVWLDPSSDLSRRVLEQASPAGWLFMYALYLYHSKGKKLDIKLLTGSFDVPSYYYGYAVALNSVGVTSLDIDGGLEEFQLQINSCPEVFQEGEEKFVKKANDDNNPEWLGVLEMLKSKCI